LRRITLPAPAANDRYILVGVKKVRRFLDPAHDNFGVTINELDILETGLQPPDPLETLVSRTRSRKGKFSVEFDNVTACTARLRH
jgi:hypothetical protein